MIKNKIALVMLALLLCCGAGAQDGYFNTVQGSTLKWVIHNGDGKLFGYCYETLQSLEGDKSDARIRYCYRFIDSNGKSAIGSKPFVFDVTLKGGTTSAYIDNPTKALKAGDYMPAGDLSSIPADISVGDRLEDSKITVKVLNVYTATNRYANRRVTASEKVTVPAGTFDCMLVEDEEVFTGAGPFAVKTWVALGTGIVRQVIYKKDGSVNQIFELCP